MARKALNQGYDPPYCFGILARCHWRQMKLDKAHDYLKLAAGGLWDNVEFLGIATTIEMYRCDFLEGHKYLVRLFELEPEHELGKEMKVIFDRYMDDLKTMSKKEYKQWMRESKEVISNVDPINKKRSND